MDGFTKAVFLEAVRSTDTKAVIEYIRDLICVYSALETIVTDRGTAFTAHKLEHFCEQNSIMHVKVAVATLRAHE